MIQPDAVFSNIGGKVLRDCRHTCVEISLGNYFQPPVCGGPAEGQNPGEIVCILIEIKVENEVDVLRGSEKIWIGMDGDLVGL